MCQGLDKSGCFPAVERLRRARNEPAECSEPVEPLSQIDTHEQQPYGGVSVVVNHFSKEHFRL